jgi:hypothetical protein
MGHEVERGRGRKEEWGFVLPLLPAYLSAFGFPQRSTKLEPAAYLAYPLACFFCWSSPPLFFVFFTYVYHVLHSRKLRIGKKQTTTTTKKSNLILICMVSCVFEYDAALRRGKPDQNAFIITTLSRWLMVILWVL